MTSSQVAEELGLSRSTIARYAAAGKITPDVTTAGGQFRFDLERVREELAELARKAREERP